MYLFYYKSEKPDERLNRKDLPYGSLFVIGATVCWGLENNCTRSISEKSTYQIVTIKGFLSGTGSLMVAFVIGEKLPDIRCILPALTVSYVIALLVMIAGTVLVVYDTLAYSHAHKHIDIFLSVAYNNA